LKDIAYTKEVVSSHGWQDLFQSGGAKVKFRQLCPQSFCNHRTVNAWRFYCGLGSPVTTGRLWWAYPPNKAPSTPKLKFETLKISGIFVKFECQAPLQERKAPRYKRKAPLLTTFWRRFWAWEHSRISVAMGRTAQSPAQKVRGVTSIHFVILLAGS